MPCWLDSMESAKDATPEMLIRSYDVRPETIQVLFELRPLGVVRITLVIPTAKVIPDFRRAQTLLGLGRDQDAIAACNRSPQVTSRLLLVTTSWDNSGQ